VGVKTGLWLYNACRKIKKYNYINTIQPYTAKSKQVLEKFIDNLPTTNHPHHYALPLHCPGSPLLTGRLTGQVDQLTVWNYFSKVKDRLLD